MALNLEICDKIKSKEVPAKTAAASIKKRINDKNPNVQILALKLADVCVKNGGHHFLVEVASRDFMDNLVSLSRQSAGSHWDVRQKVLALIQTWGLAFKSKYDLKYVTEVYEMLKREGIAFPPVQNAEASAVMIDTQTAPEWTDSDVCMRCRTAFTTFNRKHHCRNCGQTFCQSCSSKNIPLPHLGITQEVRVCDGCFGKITGPKISSPLPQRQQHSSSAYPKITTGGTGTAVDDLARKEQEELEKAIAASLNESQKRSSNYRPPAQQSPPKQESKPKPAPSRQQEEEDDEDLRAAIAASLQEMKVSDYHSDYSASRSQPAQSSSYQEYSKAPAVQVEAFNPNDLSSTEMENIRLFSELVERMEADVAVRGIGVVMASNPQLQALYAQIGVLQPKIARSVEETVGRYRSYLELNDQLTSAIKMYDQILQERLAAAAGTSYSAHGSPQTLGRTYSTDYAYGTPPPQTQPQVYYNGSPQPAVAPAVQPYQGSAPPVAPGGSPSHYVNGGAGYAPPPPNAPGVAGAPVPAEAGVAPGAPYAPVQPGAPAPIGVAPGALYDYNAHQQQQPPNSAPTPPTGPGALPYVPPNQAPAPHDLQQHQYAPQLPQQAPAPVPAHAPQPQPQQQPPPQQQPQYTYTQPPTHSYAPAQQQQQPYAGAYTAAAPPPQGPQGAGPQPQGGYYAPPGQPGYNPAMGYGVPPPQQQPQEQAQVPQQPAPAVVEAPLIEF
ncbi:Vacuolar protein-sorting-associated protein 27 [Quaeritorhiza haematococci]|nr:Vacuolar protein-sorting-associated protein 27 [Quaeritorhiza haematococci]